MRQRQPMKIIRLNLDPLVPKEQTPFVSLRGGSAPEVKMGVDPKQFISVTKTGISLSPGRGNNINIQAMPQNMRYGGMIADLDFPLSLIPITPFTPFPHQRFAPPLKEVVGTIAIVAAMAALFPA